MKPDPISSEYGTVTAPDTIRLQRLLPGPIDRLWEYLTVPEKRAAWLAGGPTELREGGAVRLAFHNDGLGVGDAAPAKYAGAGDCRVHGTVTRCEPPTCLAFTWNDVPGGGGSEVRFTLTPQGDQVLLEVEHRQLPSREDMISVAAGWHAHLELLRHHLAGSPLPGFWTLHTPLEAAYDQRIPQ